MTSREGAPRASLLLLFVVDLIGSGTEESALFSVACPWCVPIPPPPPL